MGCAGKIVAISSKGRVRNAVGRKYFVGLTSGGYRSFRVVVNKKLTSVPLSRVVHVLFNDPELKQWRPSMTVDHKNRDRTDNDARNLCWASLEEQRANQKSYADDYFDDVRGVKCKLVEESTGAVTRFDTLTKAATHLGVTVSSMYKSVVAGHRVVRLKSKDLEGEVWKVVTRSQVGISVSNMGRKRIGKGNKHFPSVADNGYARCKESPFAAMVLEAFVGKRPSSTHTVDHVDRNPENNSLANLRWATKKEQRANQCASKPRVEKATRPVRFREETSLEWRMASSAQEVASLTGANKKIVLAVANPNSQATRAKGSNGKKYICEYIDVSTSDVEGEEWLKFVAREWVTGGRYGHLKIK